MNFNNFKPDTAKAAKKAIEMQNISDVHKATPTKANHQAENQWDSVLHMQRDSTSHRVHGILTRQQQNNTISISNKRDEFFNKTIPNSIQSVNNFLTDIGVDSEDTVFAGGHDLNIDFPQRKHKFLNEFSARLIPNKHSDLNFDSEDDYGNHLLKRGVSSSNDDFGNDYIKLTMGSLINIRESIAKPRIEEVIIHEIFHNFFVGMNMFETNHMSSSLLRRDHQLRAVFSEGLTELFKQINRRYYNESNYFKYYSNEVSLMHHLLTNVAIGLGSAEQPKFRNALKHMAVWGSRGGYKSIFVQLCRGIITEYFPEGFDIYSVDPVQMQRMNDFFDQNNLSNPNISPIVEHLKETKKS